MEISCKLFYTKYIVNNAIKGLTSHKTQIFKVGSLRKKLKKTFTLTLDAGNFNSF